MHPSAAKRFDAHVAPLLRQGEAVEAGVRALTGGYIRRQNIAIIAAVVLFAISVYLAIEADVFTGWLHGLAIVAFVLPALLIARWLHRRARRRAARGVHGAAAAMLRASALLLAVTNRRLLVFARDEWRARFGPLLADLPLRAVRTVRRRPSRAFPARLPLVDLELSDGTTLDLELLTADRPLDFLEALDEARAAGPRAGART
jgi:hypothetical protein